VSQSNLTHSTASLRYKLGGEIARFVPYVVCWQGFPGKDSVIDEGDASERWCTKLANQFYSAIRDQLKDDNLDLNIRDAYRVALIMMIQENKDFDVKKWRPRLWCHDDADVRVRYYVKSSRNMIARKCVPPTGLIEKDQGFVDGLRHKDLIEVKRRLLSAEVKKDEDEMKKSSKVDEENHAIVGVYGINGMGGLGKSTLAQQIAQDHDILKIFKEGGVFWLTATKNLLNELNNLIHDLLRMHVPSVEEIETCSTIESARDMLKRVLTEEWKKPTPILIVVDDLWQASVYREIVPDREWMPSGSSVLITYRDRSVAEYIVNDSYVFFDDDLKTFTLFLSFSLSLSNQPHLIHVRTRTT
jgi:hypothetical protein